MATESPAALPIELWSIILAFVGVTERMRRKIRCVHPQWQAMMETNEEQCIADAYRLHLNWHADRVGKYHALYTAPMRLARTELVHDSIVIMRPTAPPTRWEPHSDYPRATQASIRLPPGPYKHMRFHLSDSSFANMVADHGTHVMDVLAKHGTRDAVTLGCAFVVSIDTQYDTNARTIHFTIYYIGPGPTTLYHALADI